MSAIPKAYEALNIYTLNIKMTVSDADILLLKKTWTITYALNKPYAIYFIDTLCAKTWKKNPE